MSAGDVHRQPFRARVHRAVVRLASMLAVVAGGTEATAADQTHWALLHPKEVPPPEVRQNEWPLTPVDRFILARLESNGLRPAVPATRRAYLRRVSLDLTGLPPAPEEIAEFEADSGPDAYERVVDRLLGSPRYGERWGRYWLDVARYADTKGYVFYYEESQFVQPHRYRDWVIRAFNDDLPYDRFLTLQLAADQVAPTPVRAVTGSRASTSDPRVEAGDPNLAALGFLTLGRRFLGSPQDIIDDQLDVVIRGTLGLTIGCARCHDHKFDPVTMADYYALSGVFQSSQEQIVPLSNRPAGGDLVSFSEARERIEFERELQARVDKLETAFRAACDQVADRLRGKAGEYLLAAMDRSRLPVLSANVRPAPDDINPYNVRQWDAYLSRPGMATNAVFGAWTAFGALRPEEFASRAADVVRLLKDQATVPALNPLVAGLFTNAPASMAEVAQRYGRLLTGVHQQWRGLVEAAKTNKTAVPTVLPDAAAEQVRQVLYGVDAPVRVPSGSMVELDVHLYFDDPNRVALSKLQMEVEQWVNNAPAVAPHTVAMADRMMPVNGRILRRGDPSKPGDEVPRRFLSALGGSDAGRFRQGSGRLELARAIVDPRNPLTARVMVNRVWEHHFGVGLVATPSDFGTRSEPPSHPELLDWLALRFMADGWSVKALHRLIVLSAVYRQSALDDGDAGARMAVRSRDPGNRLLHHFPRRRLDFEAMRDSMLLATGELELGLGGKAFDLETRPAVPRRTVYGRIDRRFVPGVMRSFDFANPDFHVPQRHETIVPQQALYLLNSDWVMDRARALAKRVGSVGDQEPAARVEAMYRFVHQRAPSARERELGTAFLVEAGAADGSAAAALEHYAQVLLCSNEFMNQE